MPPLPLSGLYTTTQMFLYEEKEQLFLLFPEKNNAGANLASRGDVDDSIGGFWYQI